MTYLWQAIRAWFIDWCISTWRRLRARNTGGK